MPDKSEAEKQADIRVIKGRMDQRPACGPAAGYRLRAARSRAREDRPSGQRVPDAEGRNAATREGLSWVGMSDLRRLAAGEVAIRTDADSDGLNLDGYAYRWGETRERCSRVPRHVRGVRAWRVRSGHRGSWRPAASIPGPSRGARRRRCALRRG